MKSYCWKQIFKRIIFLKFQWRNLTDGEKSHFEGKAKTMNEENARKAAEEAKLEEQ